MKARKKLRWRADLRELIVAADGGDHSVLEFRYHRDVERAHGLPEPRRQVPFTGPGGRRGRRDRVYEGTVVVELDGRLAHSTEDQWRDKTRDNAAAVGGQQTLRYGWAHVKWEACATAVEVAKVLRRHGWDGQPRPARPAVPSGRSFSPDPRQQRSPASAGDRRDHQRGVGEVGQDRMGAGLRQFCGGVAAGRDTHHAGAGGERGLHVERRVADEDGR
jgi:very-short-patch-repair endonuclease